MQKLNKKQFNGCTRVYERIMNNYIVYHILCDFIGFLFLLCN